MFIDCSVIDGAFHALKTSPNFMCRKVGQYRCPPSGEFDNQPLTFKTISMKKIASILALVVFSASALAASFKCDKASTFVEKAICADKLLNDLDIALSLNYKELLESKASNIQKTIRDEQLKWLSVRNKCTNNKCLAEAYKKRVDETCTSTLAADPKSRCIHSAEISKPPTIVYGVLTGGGGIDDYGIDVKTADGKVISAYCSSRICDFSWFTDPDEMSEIVKLKKNCWAKR